MMSIKVKEIINNERKPRKILRKILLSGVVVYAQIMLPNIGYNLTCSSAGDSALEVGAVQVV